MFPTIRGCLYHPFSWDFPWNQASNYIMVCRNVVNYPSNWWLESQGRRRHGAVGRTSPGPGQGVSALLLKACTVGTRAGRSWGLEMWRFLWIERFYDENGVCWGDEILWLFGVEKVKRFEGHVFWWFGRQGPNFLRLKQSQWNSGVLKRGIWRNWCLVAVVPQPRKWLLGSFL